MSSSRAATSSRRTRSTSPISTSSAGRGRVPMDLDTLLSARVGLSDTAHHGLRRIGSADMIVFGGGLPDPAVHPAGDIARLLAEVVQSERHVLGYGYEAGDMRLREIVAADHGVAPEQVMLTNGSA